jgi:hypothetical protein
MFFVEQAFLKIYTYSEKNIPGSITFFDVVQYLIILLSYFDKIIKIGPFKAKTISKLNK